MKKICILDYETGNTQSLKNILDKLNIKYKYSNSEKDICNSSHLILPGVGSFDIAYQKAIKYLPMKLIEEEIFKKNKPILGICVGMQIMASYGEEGKGSPGLNWIEGKVRKIDKKNISVPHVGWNTVINFKKSKIMSNIINRDFYFLNSFYFDVKKKSNVLAYTSYGLKFPSVVNKGNIFGVQFHPEKSHLSGKNLLKNFIEIN
jgi:glutamine amidotransferase